jgi:hypothetical protein
MTNTFIPTLARHPLYCVWIETGNLPRPLACVWIDSELRSFRFPGVGSAAPCARAAEHENEFAAQGLLRRDNAFFADPFINDR